MHTVSKFSSSLPSWVSLSGAMIAAAGVRTWLLARGSVPFNSDEAVVGLMARHILQGSKPAFFYGQAYLGSLDAWLVAGAYRVAGEGVPAIRLVQLLLYLMFVFFTWCYALDIFKNDLSAALTAWLLVVPAVFVTTYTTASLGGYGELMVLGMVVLWLANRIANGRWQGKWAAWVLLGFAGGAAFWVTGLSVVFLLPAAIVLLLSVRPLPYGLILLACTAFLIGSSPWWLYNLVNGWAGLAVLSGQQYGDSTILLRLTGFLLLGLSALAGIRFPWQSELAPPLLSAGGSILFIAPLIYVGFLAFRKRGFPRIAAINRGALLNILLVIVFLVVFLLSRFGVDSTGRYLLPLYVPLTLLLAWSIASAWRFRKLWGAGCLLSILVFHGLQTARAAFSIDGVTTQFDPVTRFDNRHDRELIDFLRREGETLGYSHYWIAYRLAFLSQEELIFAPRLPYKTNLTLSPQDDRLPHYSAIVDASPRTAYILTENPALEQRLRQRLAALQIRYDEKVVGPYKVLYQLSQPVRPWQLGFGEAP